MLRYLTLFCVVLGFLVSAPFCAFEPAQATPASTATPVITPTPVAPTATPTASETGSAFAVFEEPAVKAVPAIYHEPIAPDLGNVLVPSVLSEDQLARLAKEGVVVSPGMEKEFFTVYEQARYANVPIFITSDSVLHVYHLLFDKTLRTSEALYFSPRLRGLNQALLAQADKQYRAISPGPWKEAALRTVAFIGVAGRLTDPELAIPAYAVDLVEAELDLIEAADGIHPSPIFPGLEYGEDYTQYIPRGHYAGSEELQAYFKSMMWYGRMTFRLKTKDPEMGRAETRSALLLTHALRTAKAFGQPAENTWADLYNPTAFLVGQSDDLTVQQYGEMMATVYGPKTNLDNLTDEMLLDTFIAEMSKLPPPRILGLVISQEDDEIEATQGLRFMGQRFVPDAYIFRQLVYRNVGDATQNRRGLPNGLDLLAAFGSERAYQILDEQGQTAYKNYPAQMEKMQEWVAELTPAEWTSTLYNTWLYSFRPLIEPRGDGYPAFMQSTAWQDKQLHTALGSWSELKHDTVLYAKQIYAEMGGGGPAPPPPLLARGYVEPIPEFYARLRGLVKMTYEGLDQRGMLSNRDTASLKQLETLLDNLQRLAEKELRGEPLTDEEYAFIRYYGGELEHLVMASADTPEDDPNALPVLDEDPQAAVIADVATDPDPDGDGAPNPVVLQVGVGRINDIHVVVPLIEADGGIFLQVAKGGAFSYYEFPWPADDRLTDQKWRTMLDTGDAPAPPAWVGSFFTQEGEFSDLQDAIYTFQISLVETFFSLDLNREWSALGRGQAMVDIAKGEALKQVSAEIESLRAQKQYEGRQWMRTNYRSFDRQSDTLAVVTVRETWRDDLHQYQKEMFETGDVDPIIAKRGPYDLDVTYTLEKNKEGQWQVTRMVFANERPAWQKCTQDCVQWH